MPKSAEKIAAKPYCVLVVDDEEGVRASLQDYLELRGYRVLTAATITEAQSVFLSGSPEAAVIDFTLPDGNGLDLVRTLRKLDETVPLIMMTGTDQSTWRWRQ